MTPAARAETRLPAAYTRFIGRSRELGEIKQLLISQRLLTLTGPAGCGKTRLALQAATELADTFDGQVVWCDLIAVSDPARVPQALAAQLQLRESADRPTIDALTDALGSSRSLVVLDNCEQVLAACAALVHTLLRNCPQLKVLVTSLQPFMLPQEKVWPVRPLPIPEVAASLAALTQIDSVQLFVDRAREVSPSFNLEASNAAAVATICRRLDGLPLAIELAAARVRMLSPLQIADRLDETFRLLARGSPAMLPRHQTLRAALDWTHQFLTKPEQTLFRRLAVFAGSFTLETVEAVCADETGAVRSAEVLDLLSNLVDKSFVSLLPQEGQPEARYRLLEPIRQYAREQLEDAGESPLIRTRLLAWCIAWAEQIQPHLTQPDQAKGFKQLEADVDNFRTALRWACTSRQIAFGLRLANALVLFWWAHYYLTEGRSWLEELLSLEASVRKDGSPEAAPALTRAWALWGSGRLAVRQWDDQHAAVRGEESLALFRQLGDKAGIIQALNLLALVANDQHNYPHAAALYHEALELSRELGDKYMTAVLLTNLGLMYQERGEYRQAAPLYEEVLVIMPEATIPSITARHNLGELVATQGDYARAQQLQEQCLAIGVEQGNKYGLDGPLLRLGEIAREQRDWARAEQLFNEALVLDRQSASTGDIGQALNGLGNVARDRGQLEQARSLYARGRQYFREAEFTRGSCLATTNLGRLEAIQGNDERAEDLFRESLQRAQAAGLLHNQIEALEELAGVLARRGEARRAARWLFVSQAWRELMGIPVPPSERKRYDDVIRLVQSALDQEALEVIQSQVNTLTLDQVMAEALNLPDVVAEPREATDSAKTAAPDLRISALGPTRVALGDSVRTAADWTYSKSKELLFYLLTRPPATKAQIGLDLWPDSSASQLRHNFHSALHYLRRALGRADWIVFDDGAYRFNRDLSYWCDVHVFEDRLRQARLIEAPGSPQPADRARAIQLLDEATQLWRGDFLEDLDAGEWAIFLREELRRKMIDALIHLGQLHFTDAHYREAAETYRRVLSFDNYLELAHRELMRCHARQGETSQALRHYQQLRELLQRELHAEPSSETTLLFERLRRGDDI